MGAVSDAVGGPRAEVRDPALRTDEPRLCPPLPPHALPVRVQ